MVIEISQIKEKIKAGQFRLSFHAEVEAEADDLDIAQIVEAILADEVLEQYSDTGRGKSCLVVGFAGKIPIHAVCGWRGDNVVVVTVYIPQLPKFSDPWTRAGGK